MVGHGILKTIFLLIWPCHYHIIHVQANQWHISDFIGVNVQGILIRGTRETFVLKIIVYFCIPRTWCLCKPKQSVFKLVYLVFSPLYHIAWRLFNVVLLLALHSRTTWHPFVRFSNCIGELRKPLTLSILATGANTFNSQYFIAGVRQRQSRRWMENIFHIIQPAKKH